MHQRGFLFATTLIVLTLVLAAPFLCIGGFYAWECYEAEDLLSLDSTSLFEFLPVKVQFGNSYWFFQSPTMVWDQFYWSEIYMADESSSSWTAQVFAADPETGAVTQQNSVESEIPIPNDGTGSGLIDHNFFAGDSKQLWILDHSNPGHIFEKRDSGFVERFPKLADGTAVPGFYETPESNYGVVLDGRLTIIVETSYGKLEVFQLDDNLWRPLGKVKLLDTTRAWQRPGGQLLFQALPEIFAMPKTRFAGFNLNIASTTTSIVSAGNATQSIQVPFSVGGAAPLSVKNGTITVKNSTIEMKPQKGTLRIVAHDSDCHLFWGLPDCLLYRRGWDLDQTISAEEDIQNWTVRDDRPVSALGPINFASVSSEWTMVTPLNKSFGTTDVTMTVVSAQNSSGFNFAISNMARIRQWYPALVGGDPVVVTIQQSSQSPGHQIAQAIRFDSEGWSEFASTELPYAAEARHVGSRTDGSIAYLTTTTALGRNRVVALEPTGFRPTQVDQYVGFWGLDTYLLIAVTLCFSLLAGMILAAYATLLMWRDRGRYEFGIQSVELASLVERGVARTIDLAVIFGTTTVMFGILIFVFKLDWRTTLEALFEQDFDQPDLVLGSRLMLASLGAGTGVAMALILFQGLFGATPGKWICGLRTLRATLKPCGIARSLLRDVLLCVDSLNLSCWFPGILFVAFTRFRQRIGDLVADTIVVRARSLASVSTADSI